MSTIDKLSDEQKKAILGEDFDYYYNHNVDIIVEWVKKHNPRNPKELLAAIRDFFVKNRDLNEIDYFVSNANKNKTSTDFVLYLAAIPIKERILSEKRCPDIKNDP